MTLFEPPQNPEGKAAAKRPARILLVDDDRVSRLVLANQLAEKEMLIFQAGDGHEGLALFHRERPDVIVLDYHMPRLNGVEFLQALQEEPNKPAVIMLTSSTEQQVISDCYRLGVHAFLAKPCHPLILKNQINRALALVHNAADLQAEIATTEQQARLLRAVFDNIPEGVIILDHQLRLKMISARACKILNRRREEVIGSEVDRILGATLCEETGPLGRCVATESKLASIQSTFETDTGEVIPVALTITPFVQERQQTGWMLLFRDLRRRDPNDGDAIDSIRFGSMVSGDIKMKEVFALIEKVAPTNATVLIQGESGTGKELVARELHERGPRGRHTFLAVNCAAIPAELLESEFFGHEKGSFTGAHQTKIGRFEQAQKGTLFLDEIGEMPYALQGKLLRVLQERKLMRVGGNRNIEVDVRIVAATNKDLKERVQKQLFREDLYYRLAVIPIRLPPLRERILDVPHLVRYLIEQFREREGSPVRYISSDALHRLLAHDWPGNIRELVNVLEYCFAVCREATLGTEHLPREFQNLRYKAAAAGPPPPANEKEFILRTLESVNYRKGKAAAKLGINPSTLYRKMKKYGLS
ncbi:sigma 54-interacting transcriptional regulator [Acanthopleuribacter pedis]|uniref:Sigma 54-interacting transcriptional regulator n=1 Tax=Acanthopleuribacter pedis TaxID=442870 RepID=A0A8J7Q392_9BACT|nr:sigma 54-interacting transcriptional regulator [Acanthopleuribacter pedis]